MNTQIHSIQISSFINKHHKGNVTVRFVTQPEEVDFSIKFHTRDLQTGVNIIRSMDNSSTKANIVKNIVERLVNCLINKCSNHQEAAIWAFGDNVALFFSKDAVGDSMHSKVLSLVKD